MGLLDIIRKPKPSPEPCEPKPDMACLASPAEFFTACLLMTDLPLPKSKLDEVRKTAHVLLLSVYRRLYNERQVGPSPEMSDSLILEIYRRVGCAFREASKDRGEFIESAVINVIVLHFLDTYRMGGPGFFEEHLQYEIEGYKGRGLRAYWVEKKLDLFG